VKIQTLLQGLCVTIVLVFASSSNVSARSNFWTGPPDGSTPCVDCHGATTSCAGCHAHGTHPDNSKSTMNVSAVTDKTDYAAGETVTITITGGYRAGYVRAKLWDKDCSAVGCSSNDAVVVASNTCASCPVGVGGDDGVTSEFPGPVVLTFLAPNLSGSVTWSASWYGNNFDLTRIGGSTTFGSLWLPDPNPAQIDSPHGDEIVTFSFNVSGGNRAPNVFDDSASTLANTPVDIDVLLNDTDDDGDTLTVNSFDAASSNGGSVSCSLSATSPTPQCNFTPVIDSCLSDSFTYDATDGTDPSATRATVTIQVGDTNAPIVTPPTNVTVLVPPGTTTWPATDPAITAFLTGATATDTEDGSLPVSNNAPTDFPVGTTPVTFSATDVCGNTGTAAANVIIQISGNDVPVVTAPSPLAVTAPLCATSMPQTDSEITAWLGSATANDTEDGPLPTSHNAPLNFPLGDTIVTFSAIDSLSATGTADSTLTVNETPNTPSTVTAPAPLTVIVSVGTTSVPATDPEIAAFLAAATANDTEDGPLSVSNDAPADFPLGTTLVTFSATDSCAQTSTSTSTLTIQESSDNNRVPKLKVPNKNTRVTGSQCASSIPASHPEIQAFLNAATATDFEDGDLTGLITHNAPTDFPASSSGELTRVTFSVTDSGDPSGIPLTAIASSRLTAIDPNTAATVTAPAPLTVLVPVGTTSLPASNPTIAAYLAGGSANDAEDGVLAVSNDAPTEFPVGTTAVTFVATDGCGLVASEISTVTIEESAAAGTPPNLTAPSPITVTAGLCGTSLPASDSAIAAFLNGATANDTEDGNLNASIVNDAPGIFPASISPGIITTVTFSVTDSGDPSGITSTTTASSTITVVDPNTVATVTAPSNLTIALPFGNTDPVPVTDPTIAAFLAGASANDTEDGVLSVSNDAPGSFSIGTTLVTFTTTDSCGQTATATATVTIDINNPPSLTVPIKTTVIGSLCATSIPASHPEVQAFLNAATATDVEDGDLTGFITHNAPTDFPAAVFGADTRVTFSVTDSGDPNGVPLTSIASSRLTGVDPNTAATVTAPAPISFTIPVGTAPVPVTDPTIAAFLAGASANDAEDGVLSVSNDAPADFPLGTTTVTFSASDGCGLTATATSTVTIAEE